MYVHLPFYLHHLLKASIMWEGIFLEKMITRLIESMQELAYEKREKYKEGKFILER